MHILRVVLDRDDPNDPDLEVLIQRVFEWIGSISSVSGMYAESRWLGGHLDARGRWLARAGLVVRADFMILKNL